MESIAKVHCRHQPLLLSLHHHRPSFSRPISSLSFRTPSPSSSPSLKSSSSIRSSSSSFSDPLLPNPKNSKPQLFQTLSPFPFSVLKITFVAAVAATALFFARFNLKPLIAAPIAPPPSVQTTTNDAADEEKEKALEEHLISHPDDIQSLRNLMEVKIKTRKLHEAIGIIEHLIKLEPIDTELPLLKAHMHCYSGDLEMAKLGFNEILSKDPLRVEAYHGLVMTASQVDSGRELKEIEKRIEEGMEMCKKEKMKKEDSREFKLLIAQIRVIEEDYNDALKVYQELVKEEPGDFRPYLCQGIIYTLLRKKDEADKQFQKYRSLVPKGHPYARFFDDNMMATKVFAQKVENERAS